MSDICLYLGMCAAGYLIAIPLRKRNYKLKGLGKLQNVMVVLLVFTMGLRIGADDEVLRSLGTYGLYALILAVMTIFFSVLAVTAVRRMLGIDRYGRMEGKNNKLHETHSSEKPEAAETEDRSAAGGNSAPAGKKTFDWMTVFILLSVIAGILAGAFLVSRITDDRTFSGIADPAVSIELCTLLALVGLDMGLKGDIISQFRSVGLRVLAIPAAVAVGTLFGSFVTGLFLPIGPKTSLAVGAGLGWYSLAAGILMNAGMMSAGAISFLHNVMRELLAIVCIPLVSRHLGYVEAVALPGAAAMDTCLPIVVRATSPNTAVYSFISGLTLSLLVPVLVPLFC